MKRVIADYMSKDETPDNFDVNEFLEKDEKYSPALNLFDGEPYYLKIVDREYGDSRKSGTTLMRVDNIDGETFIDRKPLDVILKRFNELMREEVEVSRDRYIVLSTEDKTILKYGVSLVMFFMRVSQDKEIVVSENRHESVSRPSRYVYNPNKPVIIDNKEYERKAPMGRNYEKQAEEWIVRAHYRVRNGVKYLVKGYKKTFNK